MRKITYRQTHTIAAIMFRDSSFRQYKVYARVFAGVNSLEMRHQTTGWGSRVMRTCCVRILKFIRYVCNKFAVRRFRR